MDGNIEERKKKNTNNENLNTIKKPVNRKPPVIKQTLTSMYRIAKANPLLLVKDEKLKDTTNDFGLSNIKLPKSVLQPCIRNVCDSEKLQCKEQPSTKLCADVQKFGPKSISLTRTTSLRMNKAKPVIQNTAFQRSNSIKISKSNFTNNNKVQISKQSTKSTVTINNKSNKVENANKPKRRSLSAEHFERKRKLSKPKLENLIVKTEITQSLTDIDNKTALIAPFVSPIIEERRRVTFKTPSAYNRRSVSFSTPMSCNKSQYRHILSTPRPTVNDLQNRLEQWLEKHKKPLHSFHHLKCFGLSSYQEIKYKEDDKENIEEMASVISESYEDLEIPPQNCSTPFINESNLSCNNIQQIVQSALTDLHKLILEGYSREQCEAWLGLIRSKYQYLEEEPQYWECRAAIEQSRGNITSAVECLRTAIVQGAEVKAVDHSLEQLLQKFSLLNISTSDSSLSDEDKAKKDRVRIVLDARNVFKSSIIQFAVQERTLKKNRTEQPSETKFIATPVRRSTRISRSKYTSTPSIKLCGSLQDLDDNVRHKLDFHGNNALSADFCRN